MREPRPHPRPDDGPAGKRGRSVPAVYGTVSLVLVVGAVTFALSTPPPSTPPLASVAPAPQEQLEVERVEQSSRFGEGTGGEGDCVPGDPGCGGVGEAEPVDAQEAPGQPPAVDQGEPEVVETRAPGELRRCAQGPGGPRQTEDPQSPACVATVFAGDNGGPTYRGVTAEAVRIGVPSPVYAQFSADRQGNRQETDMEVLRAWARHVENHYELYGRRLELVEIDRPDGDTAADERAFAAEVEAADVFAVLQFEEGSIPFYRALAERGIVGLESALEPVARRAVYDAFAPYVWGIYPPVEDALDATGDLACTALAGRTARHGGAGVADQVRRFGVIVEAAPGRDLDASTLVNRLTGCGADHAVHQYQSDDDREALLRRLDSDGVTTVVCVCRSDLSLFMGAADTAGYQPEWLLAGFPGTADTQVMSGRNLSEEQRGHVFGLAAGFLEPVRKLRSLVWENYFWFHALKDERPDYAFTEEFAWELPPKAYSFYAQIALVLGTGIQGAGPELTPEAFATGLRETAFPNPGVGQAPWFQPSVGFGPGDATLNDDYALLWWRTQAPNETTGQFCYVGDGRRFTVGSFPADADEKFFDPEAGCR